MIIIPKEWTLLIDLGKLGPANTSNWSVSLNNPEMPHTIVKEYESAVGIKTARVYISRGTQNIVLDGSYFSEGKNILSGPTLIRLDLDDINQRIAKFFEGVDSAINSSYARKLFLRQ